MTIPNMTAWRFYASAYEPQIGHEIRGIDLDAVPALAGRKPGHVIRTAEDLFIVCYCFDQVEFRREEGC